MSSLYRIYITNPLRDTTAGHHWIYSLTNCTQFMQIYSFGNFLAFVGSSMKRKMIEISKMVSPLF